MRNIFLFIRQHFNLLFFLLLQGFCIYLIVHYNSYHNAIATGYMSEVTGRVDAEYSKAKNYFDLKQENDKLAKDNERLKNLLKADFESPDTATRIVTDSIPYDTLGNHRKWLYKTAKVVSNSVSLQSNFIGLGRGAAQNIQKYAGVIDANNAVVGIVADVSTNFTVVMSLLHKDSRISGKLKKGGDVGWVTWDGKDPNRLSLTDIRKSAKVARGDTVLTSGLTTTFPFGLMIGTIDEITADKGTNNFIIKLKSSANFYDLQHVFVIDNLQKDELNQLLDKTTKQTQ